MRALLVPVGDDWYAFALDHVREVVTAPAVTRLPTAPPEVAGVFNLRGEVVPLLDTARLLGVGSGGESTHAVVLDTAAGPAGVSAGGEPEVAMLPDEALPAELPAAVRSHDLGDRIVTLLDVERLITRGSGEET